MIAAHVLEHLVEPWLAVREMVRVLRPGATLMVVVTRNNLVDPVIRLKWPYAPIRSRELVGWLRGAGLEAVSVYPLGLRATVAHWLSRAYVARKRATAPTTTGLQGE